MKEKTCFKCGIPYSDEKVTHCLLCGAELVVSQPVEVVVETVKELKAKKSRKTKEVEISSPQSVQIPVGQKQIVCEVTEVPPFDDTDGFSKKNNKQDLQVGQLQADNEALRKRLNDFEGIYKEQHPEPKPWYADVGKWLILLLVLGMLYMIYLWVESQGGLPHEFYDLLRRIGL